MSINEDAAERAQISWRARHPRAEETERWEREQAYQEGERMKERVKQHKPKVLDVQSDGEYLAVEFTRANGERVSGKYKLWGWGKPPATELVRMGLVGPRGAAKLKAAGLLPPGRGQKIAPSAATL